MRWYDFEGDRSGCDENCRGWDGVSHRCDCGNRRVAWQCSKRECHCNAERRELPKSCCCGVVSGYVSGHSATT